MQGQSSLQAVGGVSAALSKLSVFARKAPEAIAKCMPVMVIGAGAAAMAWSEQVRSALPAKFIPWMLGAVMFGMGLALKARDFAIVFKRPGDVVAGVIAQFAIMPLVAWVLVHTLGLPPDLALGVVLVGACPGGTASNVITYLAKGDVALSVAMTSCSTLLAPVVTPLVVLLLAGESIDVNGVKMFFDILKIVIAPILLGVAANEFFPAVARRIRLAMPAFSAIVVAVIVASVVAAGAGRIRECALVVFAAVVLHNAAGMALGWLAGKALRMDPPRRRTLAIEVGMQNSGLAVSLAAIHFAAMPLAAVPGAIFSVWHNLSGALFASACNRRWKAVRLSSVLKAAFTVVLLVLLYRKVDFGALRQLLAGADLRYIPLFLAIATINMWISSLRWRLFLVADGLDIPVRTLFASHWIASFCNFFLPSNVGGDIYRMADIGAKSGSFERGTASVFMDRLCGFLAMSLLGFTLPLAGIRAVPARYRPWLLVPVAFFAAFSAVFLVFVFKQGLVRALVAKLPPFLRKKADKPVSLFLRSVASGGAHPGVVAKALSLSVVFQLAVFAAMAATGCVLRFPIPFLWYFAFAPLVCILESLPISVNGMGLREAAYAVFFAVALPLAGAEVPEGMTTETFSRTCGGAMALCYMALTLLFALGGGILLLVRINSSKSTLFHKHDQQTPLVK